MVVRVFLVDDHEVVRRGIVDLLGSDPELEVVGEAGSVAQAMARIPAVRPDVAVLDSVRERLMTVPGVQAVVTAANPSAEGVDGRIRISSPADGKPNQIGGGTP